MTVELLLDTSAWARFDAPSLDPDRVNDIALALEQRRIAVCLPFLLEAGYSAPNAAAHRDILEELQALPQLHLTPEIERRATDAQAQLARAGHHRLPPVDLMIAAIADAHRLAVLHYDSDYDTLRTRTDLRFQSTWLAPRGTL